MHYCFFSDLHIKKPNDEATLLVKKFFDHPDVKTAKHVFFLGDIFDFMVGEHSRYINLYSSFFDEVISLTNENVEVTFLEGNHDFHLKNTILNHINKNSKNPQLFHYKIDGFDYQIANKTFYICHGDEVDYHNEAFKRWKKIYRSSYFKLLVNKLLPFSVVESIGNKASQDSKNRGRRTFDLELAQKKYRKGALELARLKNVDGIICGHTHIQENVQLEEEIIYYNCGYPLKDKNFLKISSSGNFINL